MNNEYGVACLLEESSKKTLSDMMPFLDKDNIPHVSLFQFRTGNITLIKSIEKLTQSLFVSNEFFVKSISLVDDNVFLNIVDDSTLKNASDEIAEHYSNICHHVECLSQIKLNTLTIKQASLVKKYGIYWVKENYRPHVTISYGANFCHVKFSLPDTVKIFPANIYPIDKIGRIIR